MVVLNLEFCNYRGFFALILLEEFSYNFFARSVVGRGVDNGNSAVNSGLKKFKSLFFRRFAARIVYTVVHTELNGTERKCGNFKAFQSLVFHIKPTLQFFREGKVLL